MFPSVHFLGRRTILLWGAAAETVCMFTFAIVGTVAPNSVAAARSLVAFSCLYAFFFTWSWGPVAWIVASEIGSNVMRSRTQALGSAVSWAGTLLIAVVLPYLINPTAADLGAKVCSTRYPVWYLLTWRVGRLYFWSHMLAWFHLGSVLPPRDQRPFSRAAR